MLLIHFLQSGVSQKAFPSLFPILRPPTWRLVSVLMPSSQLTVFIGFPPFSPTYISFHFCSSYRYSYVSSAHTPPSSFPVSEEGNFGNSHWQMELTDPFFSPPKPIFSIVIFTVQTCSHLSDIRPKNVFLLPPHPYLSNMKSHFPLHACVQSILLNPDSVLCVHRV